LKAKAKDLYKTRKEPENAKDQKKTYLGLEKGLQRAFNVEHIHLYMSGKKRCKRLVHD
jgi:hypothetical protein